MQLILVRGSGYTGARMSGATTISSTSLLLKCSEFGHHWSGVVPTLKEQLLKVIATLAVVAPLIH